MNIEVQFLIAGAVFGLLGLLVSVIAFYRCWNQARVIELGAGQIELLEETLAETNSLLEESRKTVTDHSRKIAWLDAKVRQSRFVSVSDRESIQTSLPKKSNIDEQKNRILKLAGLGQTPSTIAATLGMMPGEVELILNLNNHQPAAV